MGEPELSRPRGWLFCKQPESWHFEGASHLCKCPTSRPRPLLLGEGIRSCSSPFKAPLLSTPARITLVRDETEIGVLRGRIEGSDQFENDTDMCFIILKWNACLLGDRSQNRYPCTRAAHLTRVTPRPGGDAAALEGGEREEERVAHDDVVVDGDDQGDDHHGRSDAWRRWWGGGGKRKLLGYELRVLSNIGKNWARLTMKKCKDRLNPRPHMLFPHPRTHMGGATPHAISFLIEIEQHWNKVQTSLWDVLSPMVPDLTSLGYILTPPGRVKVKKIAI